MHKRADLRTPYWDWTAREGKVHYQKYAGTPPEHLLFALRQALDMILATRLHGLDLAAPPDFNERFVDLLAFPG